MTALFAELSPSTTLLTPNRRLSSALLKQFNQQQREQKKSCWPTLDILPLPSWLQRLWQHHAAQEIHSVPLLLTPNKEIILWEEILQQALRDKPLLHIAATAELAKSAWDLLQQWQIDLNHPTLALTEDSQTWQQWAKQFQKLCKKNNWLDTHSAANIIMTQVAAKKTSIPEKIILIGFAEIAPQHQQLLNTFEQAGSEIIYYQHPSSQQKEKTIHKISLTDEETEIRTMARWAKNIYDHAAEKKPYLIGCVIPRLEAIRESVLSIFSETFSEHNTFTADHTLLPFNISAGKSLAAFPVIQTAFDLLKLHTRNIPLETLSSLLRSPFLGDSEHEQWQRSNFDSKLRKANITAITAAKLLQKNKFFDLTTTCPALTRRLKKYLNHAVALKKTLPISEWVKHIIELLTLLGWPGERSLNSQEYQVTRRWLELLTEYSTFDHFLGPQKYSDALNYLVQLSAKTIFQPQTPEAPIQILGVLEAADLPFEHLWVMGLDDNNWPSAPKPNPFLPQQLQKKLQMPHATAERELTYCAHLTEQLKKSAHNVIFSHALKNEDTDLRPSSLLNNFQPILLEQLKLSDTAAPAKKIFNARELETLEDNIAPAMTEHDAIRGGSYLFKSQAACPFKAFTELRLHAKVLETPTLGIKLPERGNIVHKALELIWQELNDSETLKKLTPTELKQQIHRAAEQALTEFIDPNFEQPRYLSLELQRLEKLLWDWLQLEAARPAFKVAFREQEKSVTIGKIPVTLRIDRIDEIADGQYLIIDYKTGKNSKIDNWFGERPDEPQLPLYCVTDDTNCVSIAFAKVNPSKTEMPGVSKYNLGIKTIKLLTDPNWEQQTQNWKMILEKLGDDFYQGIAHVDPKNLTETCKNCHLHAVCRIHEKIL